jgi:hypothetical protein
MIAPSIPDRLYKESRDYSFAQVLIQEGKTLAAWLTDGKGSRVFSLLKMEDGEVIDVNLENGQEEHIVVRNFATYCDRNDAVFLLPVISNGVFDRISVLECALSDSHKEVRDRDQEIANLKTQIAGFQAALELANDKHVECDRQSRINDGLRLESQTTFECYQSVLDELRGLFDLPLKRNYLDLARHVRELQNWVKDHGSNVKYHGETIQERTIAILEDNLDRARSEHQGQLLAIIQMLHPLIGRPYNSTENKDGKTYVHVNHTNEFTHAEKNSVIKLIQKVVYANIKRLDPCLTTTSYSDDF